MAVSLYDVSIPVFIRALNNLAEVLKKGGVHALGKHIAPDRLLEQRLIFDMFPLVKQVQIACDTAAKSAVRLAGIDGRVFEDNEKTLADVQKRIKDTVAYLETFTPAQINAAEGRTILRPSHGAELHYQALAYVTDYALPNLLFHCTTAYNILRVAGADIGKKDFLGPQ